MELIEHSPAAQAVGDSILCKKIKLLPDVNPTKANRCCLINYYSTPRPFQENHFLVKFHKD